MQIAIFGGSFDPPHIGHEMIIKKALKLLRIDMLFVIPTWLSPFKNSFKATPQQRFELVKNAWGAIKGVHVVDFEIAQKRAVSTYESVCKIKKEFNPTKIYLIIGADSYEQISQWNQSEKLLEMVKLVVATRSGHSVGGLKILDINANISSSKLRENLDILMIPNAIQDEVLKIYTTRNSMQQRVEKIVQILDEKKGEDIAVFDMSDKEYFVERVIIATTLGERHGSALLNELKDRLKNDGEEFLHVDETGEWVVVDLGDILIQCTRP